MWEATFKMSPFCSSLETTPRAVGKAFKSRNCALAGWESRCQCLGRAWGYPEKLCSSTNSPGRVNVTRVITLKFISAIKCNCAHTADVSVLGKLSLAQEAVENVVLVAPTSAAVLLRGQQEGTATARQGASSLSSVFVFS